MEKLFKEFKFPLCKLKYQEPTQILNTSLQLFESYAIYHYEFWADEKSYEDDLDIGVMTADQYNYQRSVIRKSSIPAVELVFVKSTELWLLRLNVINSTDVEIYFETQGQAIEYYNVIQQWFLS